MCQDSVDWPFNYRIMLQEAIADAVDAPFRNLPLHPCAADPYFVPGSSGSMGTCGRTRPLCKVATPQATKGVCAMPLECKELKPYCGQNSVAGVRARQLCPMTCGCDDPLAPLALSLPFSGCGSQCFKTGSYLDRLEQMSCEDNNTALQLLLDNMEEVLQEFPRDWRLGVGYVSSVMRTHGCDYLAWGSSRLPTNNSVTFPPYVGGMNLCTSGGTWFPIKPLSYVCPVACGCRSGDAHCPGTCPPRTSSTPRCPDHQRIHGGPMLGSCPAMSPRSLFVSRGNHT